MSDEVGKIIEYVYYDPIKDMIYVGAIFRTESGKLYYITVATRIVTGKH